MKVLKFVFLFIVLMVILAGFVSYSQFSGTERVKEEKRFVIKPEIKEEQIISDLIGNGFIKNKNIFNFILTFKNWHDKIRPGAYLLSKSQNAYEIAKILTSGPYQKWVIIPPGKRKEQVALILQKALGWQFSLARGFVDVAQEGYLFPDTYLIDVDYSPEQVWQKLYSNFNEKFDAGLQKELLNQNIRNDTAIKIASLIERESGGAEDKPIISAIIWNRLLKGMRLEIDATVQYAIASEKLGDEGLQSLDNFTFWQILGAGIVRTIDSPYNTYLNNGLPPGPICSPSLQSIKAVAYPAQTDALYYLHSSDKKIHTADTYEEHLKNIEEFLN